MAEKNNVYKYDKKNIQGGAGRLLWNNFKIMLVVFF
jgi:hypothetical protein